MALIIDREAVSYQLIKILMERKAANLPPLPLQEAYKKLAKHFNLSNEDLNKVNQSDQSNKWETEVRFACTELRKLGVIKKQYALLEITAESYAKMQSFYQVLQTSQK